MGLTDIQQTSKEKTVDITDKSETKRQILQTKNATQTQTTLAGAKL